MLPKDNCQTATLEPPVSSTQSSDVQKSVNITTLARLLTWVFQSQRKFNATEVDGKKLK